MYLLNTTKKPIKDISFEGFWFSIPVGVSLVWEKFGAFLVKHYQKTSEGGAGVAPVIEASATDWKGQLYAEVRRFEINAEYIPNRAELLKIAKTRGISAEQIEQWKEDESIEPKEIAKAINDLEVPDVIRFPEPTEAAEVKEATTAVADDLVKGPAAEVAADATPKVPKTQKAPAAPKKRTPAAATPKTPKAPKPKSA